MSNHSTSIEVLASTLREAFVSKDLNSIAKVLGDEVRWGLPNQPRTCNGRSEVISNFKRLLEEGVEVSIDEVASGNNGVLLVLSVDWPLEFDRPNDHHVIQVFFVRDREIIEIRRFDDKVSASIAAGLK